MTGLVDVMWAAKAGLDAVLVQLSKCLILHCNKMTKRSLLKGQWHFRRHVCIGAAGKIWGLRCDAPGKKRAEETCINRFWPLR